MQLMSVWGPLIYAGCFAATLSTALTNLLSVPRLIQALGQDRIYPWLFYFSKGYGKSGEPYRGYVLTFGVAALFLLIGNMSISTYIKNLTGRSSLRELLLPLIFYPKSFQSIFSFSQSQRSRTADLELLLSVVRLNQFLHFSRSAGPSTRMAA